MADEKKIPKMNFQLGEATDTGRRRDHNEDSLDFFEPQDPEQAATRGALYVVADGMGGHEAGAVASDRAVRKIIDEYYYGAPELGIQDSLARAIEVANRDIFELASRKPEWSGMGTTVVAIVVRGNELYVAHVGDSRAYLIRGERVFQLTQDHTWVNEQVQAGAMTPEEARRHPRRNQLTRSLGRRPTVQPTISEPLPLEPNDVVLLCTDGLSDLVGEQDLQQFVSRYAPQEAADRLVDLANRRAGHDNITVLTLGPAKPGGSTGMPLNTMLAGAGGLFGILAIALIAWFALGGRGSGGANAPTPTSIATAVFTLTPSPGPGGVPSLTATRAATHTLTSTPKPTSTLRPTDTPRPTNTPAPPTNTPIPTNTPVPTSPPTQPPHKTKQPTDTPGPTDTPAKPTIPPLSTPSTEPTKPTIPTLVTTKSLNP